MLKLNCWEYKKCGRETGDSNIKEPEKCPATKYDIFYGLNSGSKGGRCCWRIAGTFCGGEVHGS